MRAVPPFTSVISFSVEKADVIPKVESKMPASKPRVVRRHSMEVPPGVVAPRARAVRVSMGPYRVRRSSPTYRVSVPPDTEFPESASMPTFIGPISVTPGAGVVGVPKAGKLKKGAPVSTTICWVRKYAVPPWGVVPLSPDTLNPHRVMLGF